MGCNSTYRLRYWNRISSSISILAGSLSSCNSTYRLRYWNPPAMELVPAAVLVATVLTVYGMRRRGRGSRGAKRRWGPHISSPWPEGRENRGDKAIVLTVYGIETFCHCVEFRIVGTFIATVLTACGIETVYNYKGRVLRFFYPLQQYLPFTVLKQ